jgi:hypothetical protein
MRSLFEDTFLFTIVLIVLSTLIIAFIKRVHIDRLLKGFRDDFVNVFLQDKSIYAGKFDVANTGMEVVYKMEEKLSTLGELSYIIYKSEYNNIAFIVRYEKDMGSKNKNARHKQMKRAYHPTIIRKAGRGINNFFRTLKDALMDIFTQLSGKMATINEGNTAVTQSTVYTKKINQELVNTMDSSYDSILEKYIGNVVVAETKYDNKDLKITGVLKDYSSKYYEIWDVDLSIDGKGERCDVLLPTATSKIRHVGEQVEKFNLMDLNFDIRKYNRYLRGLTSRRTLKRRNKEGRLEK